MTKLFVGNLPYDVNDASLNEMFSKFGTVISAVVIMDRFSGRSKGFGFVEMDDAAAQEAINKLNGSKIGDRDVIVNVARPREESGFGGGDRGPRRDFNRGGGDRRGGSGGGRRY